MVTRKSVQMHIRISAEIRRMLEENSAKVGWNYSDYITFLIMTDNAKNNK